MLGLDAQLGRVGWIQTCGTLSGRERLCRLLAAVEPPFLSMGDCCCNIRCEDIAIFVDMSKETRICFSSIFKYL